MFTGGLQLHQRKTLVHVLYCEFCEIFKKMHFINVYGWLLFKSQIFAGVSFRKAAGFYNKKNRQLFYFEITGQYLFLKNPERLNKIIFQNTFERLLSKIHQETKKVQSWQREKHQNCPS